MAAHVGGAAVIPTAIPEEIAVAEIECAGPGVISLEAHSIRKAFLAAQLQSTVLCGGVIGVAAERLCPAKLLEIESAQVGVCWRQTGIQLWLIGVVAAAPRSYVLLFIADVGRGDHDRR